MAPVVVNAFAAVELAGPFVLAAFASSSFQYCERVAEAFVSG